jgi:protein-disulfide isomerase
MRLDQRTVILLVVSLVVIVTVLLITSPASAPGVTPTSVEQTAPVFGELDQTTITGITVTNNDTGETTVLAKDAADVWTVSEATNSSDRATDQEAVTTALGTFTALASSENFTTENLADFGLDTPTYTLVMTAADGTTYTLLVGNKAPANPRYYALVNDDTSTVYVVQQTQVNQLTNLIATPPYVPPPTATATFTPSPNPYSEVEQTATAAVEQTATTEALFAQMTAEATGEATAEAEAATEEATEEAAAEITEEATVVMQAEPTEEPTVEETEEVTEEATEEASPTPAPTRTPTSTPTPTETPTPTNTPEPLPTSIAADSERRYGRIPQNVSEEGFPQLGEPDAAVQLTLYSSFDSPDSRAFHLDVLLRLIDRIRSGQILVTFVPLYGTGNISNGERAARAAVCAAQQDAFWVMSDILFDRQGTLRNQAFTNASLNDTAAIVGVDEAEWQECLDSDLPGEVLAAAQASAEAQSVDDTPTVLIDGEPADTNLDRLNTAIDAAMQTP